MIASDELKLKVKKLQFLEESNKALLSIQDKLEQLAIFHKETIFSYDIHHILNIGFANFQELVKIEVCSIFLVDEKEFEFVHKISVPENLFPLVRREVEAQINSETFGWVINNGLPACIPTEIIGKESSKPLNILIIPISNREKTRGVITIIFEADENFIRQQTLKLLFILASSLSTSLENAYLFNDLKLSYFDTIKAISNSIEARDPYTRGHSTRVAHIAKGLAKELGWRTKEIELIDWGGILHDVGKIGIYDAILHKKDLLTDQEFGMIKTHPLIGAEIVKGISFLEPVLPYIMEHHEKYDGTGYPFMLSGENISIQGRLLAISDAYDAMTTDRPYRKGFEPQVAFEEIRNNKGSQFDPKFVKAFEKYWIHNKGDLSKKNLTN